MQKYKFYLNQPNLIQNLTFYTILPALAGSFQAFVKLALQQLFGR